MDQKPWHQKEKLDPAFPFRLWDSSMRVFSPHWHEPLEIIYVLRGTISLSVDGQFVKTGEGDIDRIMESFAFGNCVGNEAHREILVRNLAGEKPAAPGDPRQRPAG
ncbi:MAG: cupin domain-containing protein [Treponema sp.]|jgi:hypothetical protein|nr:cupin domain-containing protein [Treponema sp.]